MDLKCGFVALSFPLALQRAALLETQAKKAENSHSSVLCAYISPNF